ncbi:hypothetical protein QBC46DRAFT_388399 [Diplogelasinospora grovesii]|uniref:Extracellular membrane protein CFEM domain-containing protein n=1 Tax=Diplogelasinospora grovesii TaxID=303347 RepID=A0AAN6N6K9_9PEZI|nr:hypothetical protein QBC46DRAFT_388399 [Diplogelasinospora grovesii]
MKFNIVALFAYPCLAVAAAAAAAAPGQPGSAGIQLHVEFPLAGAGWPDDYDEPGLAPKKKKKPKPAWTPVETEDVPSPQVPECGVDCLLQYHAILGCEFVDDWACLCR